MSKTTTHKTHKYLHIHPVHFQVGVYVAIATLVITATKTGEGLISVIYGMGSHHGSELVNSSHMREAETHTGHAQLSYARPARVSGA